MRTAYRVQVRGRDYVPSSGPVILASNHTSMLDGPLLFALTGRAVYALTKEEMFTGTLGPVLKWFGQIPVDRFAYDPAAVKSSLVVLERGDVLAVYPEGTRGAGVFETIKPGVAYLALCTGAPIIPVATLGARHMAQSGARTAPLRSRIDIVFGQPIYTEPVGFPRRRRVVRSYAADLGEHLRAHLHEAVERTGRTPLVH